MTRTDQLKISLLVPNLVRSGGMQRVVIIQAKYLQKRGYDVTLYTKAINKKTCFPNLLQNIEIKLIESRYNHFILKNITNYFLIGFDLSIIDKKTAIIIAHGIFSGFIAYYYKKKINIPFVLFIHSIFGTLHPEINSKRKIKNSESIRRKSLLYSLKSKILGGLYRIYLKKLEKKCISESQFVLTQCRKVSEQIKFVYKCNPYIVPLGLDYIKPDRNIDIINKLAHTEVVVLAVGRVMPSKGTEEVIRAFSLCNIERAKLLIIGPIHDKVYHQKLLKLLDKLNLDDSVLFLGSIPDSSLAACYALCDMVVYTPFDEDFGLVPLEALMYNTPSIVSFDCGAALEFPKAFLLVDASQIEQIARSIELLLHDKQLRKSFLTQRESIIKNMTWQKHTEKLAYLINNI